MPMRSGANLKPRDAEFRARLARLARRPRRRWLLLAIRSLCSWYSSSAA